MNKSEFVAQVAELTRSTKVEAEQYTNALLKVLQDSLIRGENVQFAGFGTFETKTKKSRNGINPKTKESITIPSRKVVNFRAGSKLKLAVENA